MKPILQSRTFWINVLGIALTVGQVLPPKYAGPVLAVANIGMRFLTTSSVSLTGH